MGRERGRGMETADVAYMCILGMISVGDGWCCVLAEQGNAPLDHDMPGSKKDPIT